ncbi:MAG: hypothetical protein IJB79_01080 [Candidatus Gastranaerophilales bacterium]|nr:hypothetical protein [Candidatus Gastranaerophilales bacterium]
MRISSLNFGAIKTISSSNGGNFSKPNLVYDVDKISFSSKIQEQKELSQEARQLSKEAYMAFARGKNIQKKSQSIVEKLPSILTKTQNIQLEAQKKWLEIENELEYAGEFKIRACADPFKNTQTVYDISSKKDKALVVEYKNGHKSRTIDKKPDFTVIVENIGEKSETRRIFDTQTGQLIRIDYGFKESSSTSGKADVSCEFKDGQLSKYSTDVSFDSRVTVAKETFGFENGALDKYSTNLTTSKNGFCASDEEFWFEKDNLVNYFKNQKIKMGSFASSEEEYSFGNKPIRYIKNKNRVFGFVTTADKIFCYSDSKIQKAALGLSADSDTRYIEKYFTFDEKERPQACYLTHQTNGTYEFDFDSDFNPIYDKLVWLK